MKPARFSGAVGVGLLLWLVGAVALGALVFLLLLPVARALTLPLP